MLARLSMKMAGNDSFEAMRNIDMSNRGLSFPTQRLCSALTLHMENDAKKEIQEGEKPCYFDGQSREERSRFSPPLKTHGVANGNQRVDIPKKLIVQSRKESSQISSHLSEIYSSEENMEREKPYRKEVSSLSPPPVLFSSVKRSLKGGVPNRSVEEFPLSVPTFVTAAKTRAEALREKVEAHGTRKSINKTDTRSMPCAEKETLIATSAKDRAFAPPQTERHGTLELGLEPRAAPLSPRPVRDHAKLNEVGCTETSESKRLTTELTGNVSNSVMEKKSVAAATQLLKKRKKTSIHQPNNIFDLSSMDENFWNFDEGCTSTERESVFDMASISTSSICSEDDYDGIVGSRKDYFVDPSYEDPHISFLVSQYSKTRTSSEGEKVKIFEKKDDDSCHSQVSSQTNPPLFVTRKKSSDAEVITVSAIKNTSEDIKCNPEESLVKSRQMWWENKSREESIIENKAQNMKKANSASVTVKGLSTILTTSFRHKSIEVHAVDEKRNSDGKALTKKINQRNRSMIGQVKKRQILKPEEYDLYSEGFQENRDDASVSTLGDISLSKKRISRQKSLKKLKEHISSYKKVLQEKKMQPVGK